MRYPDQGHRTGAFVALFAMVAYSAMFLASAHAGPLTGPKNNLTGSGTITTLGGAGEESFEFLDGPAGGAVTITATPAGALQLSETLIAPNGNTFGSATAAAAGDAAQLVNVPLTLAGVWTLHVDGFSGSVPGDYQLQVVGSADASISAVPEPSSLLLVLTALSLPGLSYTRRTRS